MKKNVYLKPNVIAEPLFNQWYAWSYLISPATAAMYVAKLHLRIMQSFVANPQVHVSALKDPAMIGGPFINYEPNRSHDVLALMEKTRKEQTGLLEFAQSVETLEKTLANEAKGYSLEPLYQQVPAPLKGYVELVYDLNNNPAIRFIEGLLYHSPYYNQRSQSVSLSLTHKDKRPFIFSTPRLWEHGCLHLHVPFKSERLDELFKMRAVPQTYEYIKEALGVEDEADGLFSSFFTEDAAPQATSYAGNEVRIRYFGHACVLIETDKTSILFDPVISYDCDYKIGNYTYNDLPATIDYIVITHNHQDHCVFETLLPLRHKTRQVIVPKNNATGLADPSLKLVLQNIGFKNVMEIDEMETVPIEDGGITGLPFFGEHADLNIRTKLAYLVDIKGNKILCAADSNNVEPKLYEHIRGQVGEIDALFLGMECDGAPLTWLYGPLLLKPLARKMDQSRRFDGSDYNKGIDLVNQLNPKQVYVYAMGQEPWLTYLTSLHYTKDSRPIIESDKLIEDCTSRGIIAERLYGQKEIFLNPN